MRTTVEIDNDVMRALKERGLHEGKSLRRTLNAVVRRGLAAGSASNKARRYQCPTFALGKPLLPALNLDKALALADALEDTETVRDLELRK